MSTKEEIAAETLPVDKEHLESADVIPKPDSIRDMSPEELKKLERRMVRKMDMIIMPIMGILYILNYVDRNALAATKVYGILDDLHMDSQQFATVIAILFVGYIPFQIPSNLLMTMVPRPGLYLCVAATVWGVVSATTAAVQSYQGLLAVRVVLGITEAVFFPGILYFLSAWYTKKELGKRYAALFTFQMVGSAFGGFVAAACLTLDGRYGIRGWRWLFIVEGVVTVGCGVLFAFVMPEYPHKARVLKKEERDYAVWRLEMEAGAGEASEDTTTWKGFRLALGDTKIWALVWCMGMTQAIGSTNNFFPSIVQTLGYNSTNTLLLTAPPFIWAAVIFWIVTYISDRYNVIFPIIVGSLATGIVMFIIATTTLNTGARYFAMMWMPAINTVPQIMMYKTLNLHMARPYPKRAAGVAMINAIGGLSNLWASYLYYSPPYYTTAFVVCIVCVASFFVTIVLYRFHVRKLNRLLDGTEEDQALAMKSGVTAQQIALGWRYIGY